MDYKSEVKIVGYSNCGESLCAAGGRISTQPGDVFDILEKSKDAEKNASLIQKVTKSGHNSVIEHLFFNLAFRNVSVVVEQFMIEFRLASFTVKSRRYVDFGDAGFFVPEFSSEAVKEKYTKHMSKLFDTYNKLTEKGVAKEDARFVLPYCFFSNFICSMNAREFLNVLRAMLYGRGSKYPEIKKIGLSLLEQAREIAPGVMESFNNFGKRFNDKPDFSFLSSKGEYVNETPLVELISYTENSDLAVAKTALISETALNQTQVDAAVSDRETRKRIIDAVIDCARPRPLEAASYTFRLNNVSLACITHIVRHRIQCVTVPELTSSNRGRYIIPPAVKADVELLEMYKSAFSETQNLYNELKDMGESEENLIYVLLSGNTLDLTITMNARELLLFLKLRTCERAQWEIRDYAYDMLKMLRSSAPDIFRRYGPSCFVTGVCPEGRLSCGKAAEIKERFSGNEF